MCGADFEVTPIAGNSEIEPLKLPPVRLGVLPFPPYSSEQLVSMSDPDRDAHMKLVASQFAACLTGAQAATGDDVEGI